MDRINAYISTPPNKLIYHEGEIFDPTGMIITCEVDSGKCKKRKYIIKNTKEFIFNYSPLTITNFKQIFYILLGSNLIKLEQPIIIFGLNGKYNIKAAPAIGCEDMFEKLCGLSSLTEDLAAMYCKVKDNYEFVGWFMDYNALVERSTDIPFIFNTTSDIIYYAKARLSNIS